MALEISPRKELDGMVVGEDYAYELDISKELGTKTVDTYTYKIYNSSDDEVTDTFGGGSSISSGLITFGIKAIATGKYTLKFIVTCNELLPDGTTPYDFHPELTVEIE
jgi:hypothetical protein